ncbi:hypothetical protein BGZ49_005735, partial [Haplosporangium sp. Z 27]
MASREDNLEDNVESSAAYDTKELEIIDSQHLEEDSITPAVAAKRGRGRPRKIIPSSLSTSSDSSSPTAAHNDGIDYPLSSPDDAVSPDGGILNKSGQKQGKISSTGQCESCMTEDVRIFKYGKLRVCKECEGLMRTATGSSSNRRHSAQANSISLPAAAAALANNNVSVTTVSPSAYEVSENVSHPESDQHTQLQERHNDHFKQEAGATTLSQALIPELADSSPKKRGRKPKVRSETEHQQDNVISSAHDTITDTQETSSPSTGKKRGRKPKSTILDQEPAAESSQSNNNIPESSTPAGDHTLLEPTTINDSGDTSDSTTSMQKTQNKFQTTGAFLTRTASRLLGGQAVTGVDSNIHGYAYQRAVKVLNIDGTWYFGSMVGLKNGKIKVHFDGWGPEWDEWLASDSRRLKTLNAEEIQEREDMLRTLENEGLAGPSTNGSASSQAHPVTSAPTSATNTTSKKKSSGSGPSPISTKKSKGDQPKQPSAKRRISPSEQDENTSGQTDTAQNKAKAPVDRASKRAKKPTKAERLEMLFEQSEDAPLPEPLQPPTVALATGSTDSSAVTNSKGLTFRSLTKHGAAQDRRLMTPADVRALLDNVHVGMKVQARDKSKQWYESTILQIKSHRLLIQYDGWSDIFNEWMDVGSERLILPDWKTNNPSLEQSRSEPRSRAGSTERKRVKEIKPKVPRAKSASAVTIVPPESAPEPEPALDPTSKPATSNLEKPQDRKIEPISQQQAAVSFNVSEHQTAHISFDDLCSSSDELSDPLSSPTMSEEPEDMENYREEYMNEIKDEGQDDARIDTESLSKPVGENEGMENDGKDVTPVVPPYYSLGNPIQLGLEPPEILEFDYQDEEREILRIIHRVLDTGLIKNRVVETPPEEPFNQPRTTKKKKKSTLSSSQCNEGNGEGGSNREDGGSGDDEDDGDDNQPRTNTKTRDRFVALLEARQQSQGNQSSGINQVTRPIVKKDTQELQETRQLAMRNMCSSPLVRFVRQVIYSDSDRSTALNNSESFESRREKLVKALAGRKISKQKRFGGPLSKRILGLSNASNILGVTFNEAGYIESTTPLMTTPTLLKDFKSGANGPGINNLNSKITKKKRGRKPKLMKAMEDPNLSHDENQTGYGSIGGVPGTFQNLRSLTRKKRKKILVEDHITFLRRTLVPGTRIRARDRQMDWLTAVIRDVKNSRVLVHYEGYHEYFNEWIDINSERLKYDATLEQNPPTEHSSNGVVPDFNSDNTTIHQIISTTGMSEQRLDSLEATPTESEAAAEGVDDSVVPTEDSAPQVNCVQCQVKISQFRIYCMYCEAEAKVKESDREPFNLCLWCFSNAFPEQHDHPRSSFATKVIVGPRGVRPVKGGIITRFEKDLLDLEYKESAKPDAEALQAAQFQAMMGLENDQGFMYYLDQWKDRKVCAFCNDDGTSKDHFIGPYPFLLASTNRYGGTKKRHFWAHDACARHSPEVIQGKDGTWYNVSMAMRRGRTVKCTSCKEKGATIGCFDPKCGRSFHIPCTGKPMSHFEDGVIFWCPQHERDLIQRALEMIYKEQLEKEAAQQQALELDESITPKKKTVSYKPKMRSLSRLVCSYCWSATSAKWRKGYNGVLMCEDCFLAGPLNEVPMQPPICIEDVTGASSLDQVAPGLLSPASSSEGVNRGVGKYATSAEDYSHSPYLTRTAVSSVRFDHSSSQAVYLDSYEPAENQLYSLPIDTTYYDIPGRAPRWATHSGTDYHGTWLPQTVRRSVTKFTNPNDKILSNFLGRGTDAIECFLLGRCCTAVDINP